MGDNEFDDSENEGIPITSKPKLNKKKKTISKKSKVSFSKTKKSVPSKVFEDESSSQSSENEDEDEKILSSKNIKEEEEIIERSKEQMINLSDIPKDKKKTLLSILKKNPDIENDLLYELINTENLSDDIIKNASSNESIDILSFLMKMGDYNQVIRSLYGAQTADLRIIVIGNRKYKCPNCKSEDTDTVTKPGSHEGYDDFNRCNNCGHGWRVRGG